MVCVIASGSNKGSDCFLLLFSLFSDINQFSLFPQVLMRQDVWQMKPSPSVSTKVWILSSSIIIVVLVLQVGRNEGDWPWHWSHPFGHLRKCPDTLFYQGLNQLYWGWVNSYLEHAINREHQHRCNICNINSI